MASFLDKRAEEEDKKKFEAAQRDRSVFSHRASFICSWTKKVDRCMEGHIQKGKFVQTWMNHPHVCNRELQALGVNRPKRKRTQEEVSRGGGKGFGR